MKRKSVCRGRTTEWLLFITVFSGFFPTKSSILLLHAIHIPVPKPVREPNRCNLEPFKPETPKITLYLVLAQGRLTLQVVCLGLAHFRLPVRPPKSPSRPTRENPGRPCGGGLGGGSCQTPRWRRIVPTACGPSIRATTRMGFGQMGQPSASTCPSGRIRFRTVGGARGARRFTPSTDSVHLILYSSSWPSFGGGVYPPRGACRPTAD